MNNATLREEDTITKTHVQTVVASFRTNKRRATFDPAASCAHHRRTRGLVLLWIVEFPVPDHALIFISERSRLPVLIPIREAHRLSASFPEAVCRMLGAVSVTAGDVELERSRMSEITYGRTQNRRVLGTLNDMSFGARVHVMTARHGCLEDIALRLAETPILPLAGACPIDLTCGLFGV